ncbi:P-loop containing nucleoside triphosphate hydrolase protein [Pelagophyceae sp. CCMP2097]|nr:P-loop containing nucleoside triphosphate hydrolase protein [Pelagophyceae sp. CCMP2097]
MADAATKSRPAKRADASKPARAPVTVKLGTSAPKADKAVRKQGKRLAQVAKMESKMNNEAKWFWECAKNGGNAVLAGKVTDLFATHTAAGINFEQYSAIPVQRERVDGSVPPLNDFADLSADSGLPPWVLNNLTAPDRMRYSTPTPIQKHTIPLALAGHDVVACAQTGSGKTVAFLVPLLAAAAKANLLEASAPKSSLAGDETPCKPRALILAPTRELAIQIAAEAAKLTFSAPRPSRSAKNWVVCCYGGAEARGQLAQLAAGVEVLVATPGRLVDFLERDRTLVSLIRCGFLVLDEADRMLDMGFEPQLRKIVSRLPETAKRQTLMFSATYAAGVAKIADAYLRQDRVAKITVGRVGSSVASIEQRLVLAENSKQLKLALLLPLLLGPEAGKRTLVFVQKKHLATWVKNELVKKHGVSADDIHGDRSQNQREAALARFKAGDCAVLVATDVAARGLDVPDVDHVVQFDLPGGDDVDSYVHRIGRTGRAGRTGVATSFFIAEGDSKTSNMLLYKPILRMLVEGKQEVPTWFDALGASGPRGARTAPAAPAGNADAYAATARPAQKARPPRAEAPARAPQPPAAADASVGEPPKKKKKPRPKRTGGADNGDGAAPAPQAAAGAQAPKKAAPARALDGGRAGAQNGGAAAKKPPRAAAAAKKGPPAGGAAAEQPAGAGDAPRQAAASGRPPPPPAAFVRGPNGGAAATGGAATPKKEQRARPPRSAAPTEHRALESRSVQ